MAVFNTAKKVYFYYLISLSLIYECLSQTITGQYTNDIFTLKWTDNRDKVDFVFESKITATDNVWTAFAFSDDDKMGSDDVNMCKYNQNSKTVEHYYNTVKTPGLIDTSNAGLGFSNPYMALENGVLTCSFSRLKTYPNVAKYFDLNNQYYILFATGSISSGSIRIHSNRKFSDKKFSFIAPTTVAPATNPQQQTSASPTTYTQSAVLNDKFTVKWTPSNDQINFELSAKVTGIDNIWAAFAFSTDAFMGNDDVCVCKLYQGVSSVQHYYNVGKSPQLLVQNQPTIGFSNQRISLNNGVLTCSFTRVKAISNVEHFFDLSNNYYLLAATGEFASGEIDYHSSKIASTTTYSFVPSINTQATDSQITSTTTTTATTSSLDNQFNLKWNPIESSTNFEFSAKVSDSNNFWAAFAFSKDSEMGDDNVCVCKYSNGNGYVEHYYNNGKSPSLLSSSEPTIGISNANVKFENGVLKCSFNRLKSIENPQNYFDLSNKYNLLVASGPLASGRATGPSLQQHTIRKASDSSYDFLKDGSYGSSGQVEDEAKKKTHGCLMVIAWIFCASIGIVFARYFKFIFPNTKISGLQFWFVIHRPIMILVPIISIVAFIIILADLNWKWISKDQPLNFTHSIFGILAIGFSIIQVIVAFFRPDKGAPRRYLFNYFHRTVGLSAFLFSIIAIFLGVLIQRMNLGRVGWGIMVGWIIWVVILPIILEIFDLFIESSSRVDSYQVTDVGVKNDAKPNEKTKRLFETLKSFVLAMHLIIAFGFTIALIVVIAIADNSRFTS